MLKIYEAWDFLQNHSIYNLGNCPWRFQDSLDIDVLKVNPKSKKIKDDKKLNTLSQVYIESGPFMINKNNEYCMSHDVRLDSSGETFEKAIINLAQKVKKYYGEK